MRFVLAVLLTTALGFIAGKYYPWWSIAIISFMIALLIRQGLSAAFFAGFLGIFLLWAALALWIDIQNTTILSHKIAQVFPLGGSSILLILVTALVGGLVGGFAAMSGSSLRAPKRRRLT